MYCPARVLLMAVQQIYFPEIYLIKNQEKNRSKVNLKDSPLSNMVSIAKFHKETIVLECVDKVRKYHCFFEILQHSAKAHA